MRISTKRLAFMGLTGALVVAGVSCSSTANSVVPAKSTVASAATSLTVTTVAATQTTAAVTAAPTTVPVTTATTAATTTAATTTAGTTSAATTAASTVAPTAPPTAPGSTAPAPTVATAAPAAVTATPDTTVPDTAVPATDTTVPVTEAPTPAPTAAPDPNAVAPLGAPLSAVGRKSGAATAALQQRLTDLGFWVGDIDGKYGLTTTQGVMAYQKWAALNPSGSVDATTAASLTTATSRAFSASKDADVVEIDKTKQLLFIVHGGKTVWVLNTSTGSGKSYSAPDQNTPGSTITGVAVTYSGNFSINRQRPDGWWTGDLGQIYRPKYFNGGEAIHGLGSVPNYPASHGCVRVSVPAMDFIWAGNLIPLKMHVWVH